jgi:hypothetical protein
MAGLGFDDVFPRVISSRTHSIIDYFHAATNFAVGAMFHKSNGKAAAAAYTLGASVLVNALMTDYDYGVFRVWDFRVHGLLDYGVAAASSLIPKLLDLEDSPAAKAYFYGQGGGETLIAGISDYSDDSGAQRKHHQFRQEDDWRRRAA